MDDYFTRLKKEFTIMPDEMDTVPECLVDIENKSDTRKFLDEQIDAITQEDPIIFAERLLRKSMAIISKRELANMVYAQYNAINNLIKALTEVCPDHELLKRTV